MLIILYDNREKVINSGILWITFDSLLAHIRHFQKMPYRCKERRQKWFTPPYMQLSTKYKRESIFPMLIELLVQSIDWIIFDYLPALARHFEKCLTGEGRCAKKDSKVLVSHKCNSILLFLFLRREGLKLHKIFVDLRNYSN